MDRRLIPAGQQAQLERGAFAQIGSAGGLRRCRVAECFHSARKHLERAFHSLRPQLLDLDDVTLYARFAAHIDAALDALEAEGALPAGLDRGAVDGRAAARSGAWRSRDQRGDGAGQARRAPIRARWPRLIAPKLAALRRGRRASRSPGPGFINLRLTDDTWRDELRDDPAPRATIMAARRMGAGSDGQCRICLGQPDRADAHGPLPRRGGRRCARQPARICRHKVIREYYVNDAGGAGRRARPLGAPALPRGAGRDDRRDPRRALSGRLSDAGRRRRSPPNSATATSARPRANGWRCSASARSRR